MQLGSGRKFSGRGLRQVARGLATMDREIFETVAKSHSPLLDWTMPRLTRVADHSVLWGAIAAGMTLSKSRRIKRAAGRGVGTLAVASLVANQVAKRLNSRSRPVLADVPLARRALRLPTSTSFPSGHSASAAAFAVGVGIESAPAGLLLAGLAGAVGFSRVATGAHYPGDVIAGFGLGASIAVLGAKLVPPIETPLVNPPVPLVVELEPRPSGKGVFIAVNPASGGGNGARVLAQIKSELPEAEVIEVGKDDDLVTILTEAAKNATALGIGGGDGSICAAAEVALEFDLPLAVFSAGTFNHFAGDMGVSDVADTVAAIEAGRATKIDVATINDQVFLNTASIGAYPEFVRRRESREKKIGKPLAAGWAMFRTMRHTKPQRVSFDGKQMLLELMFVGNGRYQPQGFAPAFRTRMDDGLLDIRILEGGQPFGYLRTIASLMTGRLGRSHLYSELASPEFTLEILDDKKAPFARDGELGDSAGSFTFKVKHRALTVYRPEGAVT